MQFEDSVIITGTHKREDGYLVVDARIARTGVQDYLGSEVGKPHLDTVKVYRSPEQVFSPEAMASFAHKPVTDDHPREAVTADNWKKLSVGQTSEEIKRDGEFLRVPLMVADAATISKVENGKRELSAGYTCELDFTSGVTPEGVTYDAVQKNIRSNHVAIVQAGRAGKKCRIGDGNSVLNWGLSPLTKEQTKDSRNMENLRNIMVDGLPVQTTDAGAIVIEKLTADRAKLTAELADSKAKTAEVEKEKEEEIAKKDAALEDAKSKVLDQKSIDQLVSDRVALESTAKAICKDVETVGVSDADLKKSVVVTKLGKDALKTSDGKDETYVNAFVDARFTILAEDHLKSSKSDKFQDAVAGGTSHVNSNDTDAVRQKAFDNLVQFDQTGQDKKEA